MIVEQMEDFNNRMMEQLIRIINIKNIEKNKDIITTLSREELIKKFKELKINVYIKTSSSLLVIRLLRCYRVKFIPNIVNIIKKRHLKQSNVKPICLNNK